MFLSLCIGRGMHSQGTLCFALLLLMSMSLCVYIYCISHSCPLHSLTLSWYNLFIGNSDSAEIELLLRQFLFLCFLSHKLSVDSLSQNCELVVWTLVFFSPFPLGIGNLFVCLFWISSRSSDSLGNGNWEVDGCNSFDGCACGDGNGGQHTSHLWYQWLFCLSTSCQVQLSKPIGWMLWTCRGSGSWNWPACGS